MLIISKIFCTFAFVEISCQETLTKIKTKTNINHIITSQNEQV